MHQPVLQVCIWTGQTAKYPENINFPDSSCPVQPELPHSWPFFVTEKCRKKDDACQHWLCCFRKLLKSHGPKPPESTKFACLGQSSQLSLNPCNSPVIVNCCLLSNHLYETISLINWQISFKRNKYAKNTECDETHSKSCQPHSPLTIEIV